MYQVYQEDQDQISGATYISDVVFPVLCCVEEITVIVISLTGKKYEKSG